MKNYVWKLELQKNGMVHYHITSNVFINHVRLKEEWNALLDQNLLLEDYRKRTGNFFPNSTDVKSVRNIRDLEAYLIKYVTKESQNVVKVNAKIWDCSLALKKADYFSVESSWTYADRLRSLEEEGKVRSYAGDRYIIYRFKENPVYALLDESKRRDYYIHLNYIRNGQKAPKYNDSRSNELGNVPSVGQSDSPPKELLFKQLSIFGKDRGKPKVGNGIERAKILHENYKAFINAY